MNWTLTAGLVLVLAPLLAGLAAPLLVSAQAYRVGAYLPNPTPSASHLLGTDTTGRDLLAELLYSILPTLEIGVLAGVLGTLLGVALGLVSGYVRGLPDAILRTTADVMLGVPSLAVLVVLDAFLGSSSIAELALIIALFSWMGAARSIRAQVLSLRDSCPISCPWSWPDWWGPSPGRCWARSACSCWAWDRSLPLRSG
jgi:peptide/nickel transport system permease protein